ncbi:VRR-NUC domain-containing protein [Gaiella occulta]|uniref:VRR-NUC domain-containing protein n=1 Tax=Gaiella occulta TaxID=1002870 RepID=A0A7M2YUJ6_9ACTN|nr:VRR-NUC domain-containing protein [Gaiella occulta]RDI73289.1 VRR-NUC domain-containing protein [Gaiella occulta]
MKTAAAIALDDILEKDWQRQVIDLANTFGWQRPMHIYDSRRSEPGWPDLALVRDRLVLLELKRENGRLTADQKRWIRALLEAHVEVYVVRPRHYQELARVLQARGHVDGWTAAQYAARTHLLHELDHDLVPNARRHTA